IAARARGSPDLPAATWKALRISTPEERSVASDRHSSASDLSLIRLPNIGVFRSLAARYEASRPAGILPEAAGERSRRLRCSARRSCAGPYLWFGLWASPSLWLVAASSFEAAPCERAATSRR